MRVILATGLFAIGVELPGSYMAKHVKGLLVLVIPTMTFGWVIVAGAQYPCRCFPATYELISSNNARPIPGSGVHFVLSYRCLSHTDGSHYMRHYRRCVF
jgi:hypothetical protein